MRRSKDWIDISGTLSKISAATQIPVAQPDAHEWALLRKSTEDAAAKYHKEVNKLMVDYRDSKFR